MRITAQTVLRFFGATLLGLSATVVDERASVPKPAARRPIPIRAAPAPGPVSRIEMMIAPGNRAFAFSVKDVSGIAGLILPNSRVDVVAVREKKGKGRVASIVMQNLRVLAIAREWVTEADGNAVRRLVTTVEVTPEEGARLAEATTEGDVQLMLRGRGDRALSSPSPVTSAALTKR
jgi:Flp pilus assembly protein CpaB